MLSTLHIKCLLCFCVHVSYLGYSFETGRLVQFDGSLESLKIDKGSVFHLIAFYSVKNAQ